MPNNEDEVLQDKPVQLKGVDTSGSDIFEERYGNLKKDYSTRDLTPKTAEEAFSQGIQTYGTQITTGDIGGISSSDFELLNELYAPVNLGEGIPDQWERTQYLDRYGDKMIQLATPDTFAIRFEKDLLGLNAYNEKKYPQAVKKFIDDLDENQGIAAEMFNIAGGLVGKTAVALTGIIPLFYGIGSAIINGDSTKIFDNTAFDAWEYMDNALSENFVVYGGSDIYDFDPETGEFKQKNFFGRIWNDPIKSISSDIVPAAAFIGGAVLGEMGFAKIPKIGGITKGIATVPALGTSWFSRSVRVARGLDKLDDFAAMRKIATHRKFFEGGLKTIGTAVRTSGYESALIARSTQERTLNNLIEAHYQNFGTEPTDYEMAQYQKEADRAGNLAFGLNVPLVAGSTFLQFPRLFGRNWTLHRTGASILNKLKLGKTRIVDYKRVANADASNFVKYLGYTTATVGRGVTEAWEEFAQGAMEEGLMDYYTYPYQKDTVGEQIGFLNAMSKAANNFANSQEGLDSVAIGGLMGLLGIPLPGKINADGSISGGFQWHGGAVEGIRETRNKIRKARESATLMNSSNEMLMNNFAEFSKQRKIQESQDDFAMANDIYNFKNKEFEGLVNYVMARHENGISDTIEQDLESLEAMPLEQFNKQFASKDVVEFNEETKKEVLKNAKERVRDVLDSIEGIDAILNDDPTFMDKFNKYLAGKYGQKISQIDQSFFQKAFREYLIYLDAAGKNADTRKDKLVKEINEETGGALSSALFENAEERIVGIDPKAESLAEAVEFSDQATGLDSDKTLLNFIMQKWKEDNPKSYNKNSKKLEKKIEDAIKLGGRSSRAAALFNSLFTKKGFQSLADFSVELNELARAELKRRAEALAEELAKNPNSQSKKELNADSMFGKDNAARVKRAKDTLEQLRKVKKLVDSMDDSVNADERKEALLKELDKNPALFKTIKDNLAEDPDNSLDLTGIATIEELKNLGDEYVNAVVDMLESMLSNFTEVANALEEFIEQGGSIPPNQTEEGLDGDIVSGEKDIEEGFKPGARTAPIGMILVTPDKNINTVGNTEYARPQNHLAKDDEGWKENGQYSLNNALLNSSEFLRNLDLQEGTHEVVFRVKENQDAKFLEDPNQTIINTYYIDPNTGEEIFVGRLPAYNFDQQGNPKEMAYLAELREAIVKREEVLKNISEEGTQEVNVAEQIVNTINKIKDIDSKITEAEGEVVEVSEGVVKEILKNKDFIKGKAADGTLVDIDSGEEYQNYVKIDEEGNIVKEYQRVTDFISEEDTTDKESSLLESSTIIGTKVDTLVRDFFAGKINKDSSKEDIDSYEFDTQETRNFLEVLEKVKTTMETRGEKVVANDIILYNDELGIAGTVDLLTYDKNGKFRIYDMKTMRGNQLTEKHKSGDNKGKTKYNNPYKKGQDSNKVKHQKQLSLYRILLANTHGIVAETLGVMPIVVNYEAGDTTSSKLELIKGIPVKALDKIKNAELEALEEKAATISEYKGYQSTVTSKTETTKDPITEEEVMAVALPRTLFANRIAMIKEVIAGKRRAKISGSKGNLVAHVMPDFYEGRMISKPDSLGRDIPKGGSEVYLTKEENLEIQLLEQKRKIGKISAAEKIEAESKIAQKAFKRALETYDVIEDAPILPVKERLKAFKTKTDTKPQTPQQNLEKLTYRELQKLAKERGLSAKGKAVDIIKRLKEADASQQAEAKDSKSEIEKLNKEKEELLKTLSSLQESMPEELKPNLEKETEIFGALADIEEAEFSEIESNIEEAQKKAEEKFNKEELEKAKIIDEKFEDIVEAIIKSKINLFFDGSTSVETNHRKC